MNWGLPYKGSKNKIAEWVVDNLPQAEHLYDLFAGGCAITHRALAVNKFAHIHANDITPMTALFEAAVRGDYANETRWIDRETFFALKDTDWYVASCWSFGNGCQAYMYAKEVEPWKKALHYARVFGDVSLFAAMGIDTDGSSADIKAHFAEYKEKYILWYFDNVLMKSIPTEEEIAHDIEILTRSREALSQMFREARARHCVGAAALREAIGEMWGHYTAKPDGQWAFPTAEMYGKLRELMPSLEPMDKLEELQTLQSLQSLQSLQRLQRLQRLQSLQSLESLQRLQRLQGLKTDRLTTSQASYEQITIEPHSVIYCDIPYKGTSEYTVPFDHERFYDWCARQTELVIVSEYNAPADRFTCVAEIEKQSLLYQAKKCVKATERLFVPNHQAHLYKHTRIKIIKRSETKNFFKKIT